MAIWKSYRITEAITEIDNNKFVLPVIQRRLVWDEEKMELLFDTLLKGDSFGGIMVIEEEKGTKPLFNYRYFTKDGSLLQSREIHTLNQQQFFVIDGQQRLQSFYIGLKGTIHGKAMYFDLFSDYNSQFEFKFERSESNLPQKSNYNGERNLQEHFWYLACDLHQRLKDTNDEDQVADEIIFSKQIKDETQKTHIRKNVKAFYKNIITAESLGISKVIVNKSLDEVDNKQRIVELFRRLNDGGTKLSPFDLVASILKGFEWQMESFLEETLENYEEIGLTQDNLIKLIFLLQDNYNKEMASIEAKDAEFAIKNKERIKNTLKSLKDFLKSSELYNYYKAGNRSFIPLFFIAYHVFHRDISTKEIATYFDNFDAANEDFPQMKRWIYNSLLNGVFRSRGAGWIPYKTGIKKILQVMKKHKNDVFPTGELFKTYKNHPLTFTTNYKADNLDNLERSFLFYLIYNRNEIIRKQDIDHVMPKSILEDKGHELEKINSVNNFQLLDSGTNRGLKNGKPFKDWINNYVADKDSYIERHLIPVDESVWSEDSFESFLEKRAERILNKLKQIEVIRSSIKDDGSPKGNDDTSERNKKLNPYQQFCQKMIQKGYTMEECATMWRNRKE
ncbi:MAG: GmrSD restriction endonuclease domain-containing protein [Promethearchaeia archaeon]